VVDGDNSVVGKIVEISLFQIQIMDEEGNLVLYPNSLFMQKPIIKINKSDSVILKKEPEEELKMKKKSKQAKKIV
jgi:small-conductance mechanosensitive channel